MLQELDIATMRVARGVHKATLVPTSPTLGPVSCNSLSLLDLCLSLPDQSGGMAHLGRAPRRNELRLLTTGCGDVEMSEVRQARSDELGHMHAQGIHSESIRTAGEYLSQMR